MKNNNLTNQSVSVAFDPQKMEELACPFEQYQKLRSQCPVAFSDPGNTYLVSQGDDIRNVYINADLFSNEGTTEFGMGSMTRALVTADDPIHRRQRNILNFAFAPKRIQEMEPFITNLADELIDGFINDGECDIVERYALMIPGTIIAKLMGAPADDLVKFRKWADDTLLAVGQPEKYIDIATIASKELQEYVLAAAADRQSAIDRGEPGDDLLTIMLTAEIEGEKLTNDELFPICWQLLVAGHDTTMSLIANCVRLLSEHPEQKAILLADLDKVDQAIEEVLRFAPPAHWMRRRCTKDTDLQGVPIPAESMLLVLLGSANREADTWDNPDTFDITRPLIDSRRKTLSFGHGIHSCLGANLARMEGRIALRRLLERIPDITIDTEKPGELGVRPPNHGWDKLWVKWSPSK